MGNRNGLAIAGLIFGLIGMGLGGYVFVTNTIVPMFEEEELPDSNRWFVYDVGGDTLATGAYVTLDTMSLNVKVNAGENIYMLFTCYLILYSTATEAHFAIFSNSSQNIYYIITRTSSGTERIPVSMQYGESSVAPGNYTITVRAYANQADQVCYRTALLVHTYK